MDQLQEVRRLRRSGFEMLSHKFDNFRPWTCLYTKSRDISKLWVVSQLGWLIGDISVQMSGCRIWLPCYSTTRTYDAQSGMERGGFSGAQGLPVSIIPPIFHSRILFTCHRRYIIFVTESVFKYNTAFCHLNSGLREKTSITARHCSLKAKCEFSRILNWKKRFETWQARIPDLTPLLYLRGYVK